MIELLEQAFEKASRLPKLEQELLASRLLAELATEDAFDQALARSGEQLARMAQAALAEHRAGLTQELDPEQR
jgi:ABC-type cobalamin transport system ATPase subunit